MRFVELAPNIKAKVTEIQDAVYRVEIDYSVTMGEKVFADTYTTVVNEAGYVLEDLAAYYDNGELEDHVQIWAKQVMNQLTKVILN